MMPGCFNWPAQYAGDTAGWQEIQITEDDSPVSLVGATIKMQARRARKQTPLIDITSIGDDGIEVIDAANGIFKVGGYTVPDVEAVLIYDLQVTFSGGDIRTYLAGAYPIYAQVTT